MFVANEGTVRGVKSQLHLSNGKWDTGENVFWSLSKVPFTIDRFRQNSNFVAHARTVRDAYLQRRAMLVTSCRSLRSIGPPFRGFLVWKCAFCSGWPVHWLHKFYSSWSSSSSQSGDLGEKWPLNFACRKPPKEVVLRIFFTLKNPSGSNPRTLGPVASTLTTSPPRATKRDVQARKYFRLQIKCHSLYSDVNQTCSF
jgi:hypothetical protein